MQRLDHRHHHFFHRFSKQSHYLHNLLPKFVELKVTESTALSDVEFMKRVLLQLRNIGVAIAIDDFGTGYSSLGALHQLPIHRLKIDKSFVEKIETNTDDVVIVQMMIELTKQLKLDVIAGV
nr:EAL domain-containing protein [Shewanella acanthi]